MNSENQIKFSQGYIIKLQKIANINNKSVEESIKYLNQYFKCDDYLENSKSLDSLKFSMGIVFEQYKYKQKSQFFCSKLYTICPNPVYFFYKCLDCKLQINSILCVDCFDPGQHKDHDYRLINLQGGSCDCGDQSKWKEQTFCDKHKVLPKNNDDQNLVQMQKKQIKIIIKYYIQTLCLLYQQVITYQKYSKSKQFLEKVDKFGEVLFTELTQLNLNRRLINKLTLQVLEEKILFKDIRSSDKTVDMQIKYVLLRFIPLQNTASQICSLYIKLFYQNESFKKDITIFYTQNYVHIRTYNMSGYNDFGPQLFNNSYLIKQLCQKKIMPLFILQYSHKQITDKLKYKCLSAQQKKKECQKLHQEMSTFMHNMRYFLLLIPKCAYVYWNYFAENNGFIKLGKCLQIFKEEQYLKCCKGQKYYQEEMLSRFVDILNLLANEFGFLQRVLSQLYDTISGRSQKDNFMKRDKKYDYSMIYQRMWAIASYFLIVTKPHKSINIFTLTNDQKSHKEAFRTLYQYNKMKSLQSAANFITLIFDKVITYFKMIVHLELDPKLQNQNRRIYILYFYSVNFLYSIDSILFKLCLKFMYYLSDLNKQNEEISIKNTLALKINSLFTHEQPLIQNQISFMIKSYMYLIGIINEALFSDLSDIILSTRFNCIRENQTYKDAYFYYFNNLYNSLNFQVKLKKEEVLKSLQNYGQIILFYEQSAIMYCCSKSLQKNKKFEMNFDYFYHLKLKIKSVLKNMPKKVPLNKINFYFQNPHRYFISQTNIIESFINFMEKTTSLLEKMSEEINITGYKNMNDINSQRRLSFMKQKMALNKISIDQMHKLSILTKDKQLEEQLNAYWKRLYASEEEEYPFKMQQSQSSINEEFFNLQMSSQNDNQNVSEGLVNEQSVESISEVIKVVQFKSSVLGKAEIEICVVCNAVNDNHQLSLLCSIEFSRFYNNFGIDSDYNYIFFSTCDHYVHDVCRKNIIKPYCPQCKKKFDFIFLNYTSKESKVAEDAYIEFSNGLTQAILNKVKQKDIVQYEAQLQEKTSSQIINSQQQKSKAFIYIFQSLIIFILRSLLIYDKQTYINRNINIYKNLFLYMLKFKFYFGNIETLNEFIDEQLFKNINFNICHLIIKQTINNLGKIMFQSFDFKKNNHYDGQTLYNPYINHKLNQKQETYLRQLFQAFKITSFFKNNVISNVEQKAHEKIGKIHDKYSFKIKNFILSNPMTQITIQLPDTLAQLQEMYKGNCSQICVNHKKQNKCLYIQYIQQKGYPHSILKCCILCLQKNIHDYSLHKRTQILMIRSDTGQLSYFRAFGNRSQNVTIKSLYLNKLGQIYRSKDMETIPKTQFYLDKEYQKTIKQNILANNIVQGRKFMTKQYLDCKRII